MRETHRQLWECVARGLTGCEWLGNSSLMQYWGQTGARQGIQRKEGCWAKHLLFSLWLSAPGPSLQIQKKLLCSWHCLAALSYAEGLNTAPHPACHQGPRAWSESQSQQVQALTKGPTSVQCHPGGRNRIPVDQGLCLAWEGTALWKCFP